MTYLSGDRTSEPKQTKEELTSGGQVPFLRQDSETYVSQGGSSKKSDQPHFIIIAHQKER